ncbi:MAG: hypothetical protein M3R13_06300 [Armatimonadota bacterium]|nr:hypothetical protein [Armatimonadota bacterium]
MNTEEPTEVHPQPRKPTDYKRVALISAAVLILAAFAWALASKFLEVRSARHEGVLNSARAFSSATLPLLDLRSKGILGDEGTMQRVVDDIVSDKKFSFAAILDSQGRVLAASDRNVSVGTGFPDYKQGQVIASDTSGLFQVVHPVAQDDVVYGAVVLRSP